MTEMFPAAESADFWNDTPEAQIQRQKIKPFQYDPEQAFEPDEDVDEFLAAIRRCNDRQCETEKRELLDVLRRVHTYTGADDSTAYKVCCAYCEAWLDGQEPHETGCPQDDVAALLEQGGADEDMAKLLRRVDNFFRQSEVVRDKFCIYCGASLASEAHSTSCPRAEVESVLKRWERTNGETDSRGAS